MSHKLMVFAIVLLFLFGCEFFEKEEERLPAPQNLRFTAIDNGLGVRLEWDEVDGADEYRVYFNSAEIVKTSETNFVHSSSSIDRDGLGSYYVTAYDEEEDEESPISTVVSTKPKGVINQKIYDRDEIVTVDTTIQTRYDTLGEYIDTTVTVDSLCGAYAWSATGAGTTCMIGASEEWDMYLDDGDPDTTNSNLFRLLSPNTALTGMEVPNPGFDTTYIYGPCTLTYAPETITSTSAPSGETGVVPGEIYYLKVDGDYYVKMEISKLDTVISTAVSYAEPDTFNREYETPNAGITFRYYFQKIKIFRRF